MIVSTKQIISKIFKKIKEKRIFQFIIIFMLSFISIGCECGAKNDNIYDFNNNSGSLSLLVTINTNTDFRKLTKTTLPDIDKTIGDYYILLNGPNGQINEYEADSSGLLSIYNLSAGEWTIAVTALNFDNIEIGMGEEIINISQDHTESCEIIVTLYEGYVMTDDNIIIKKITTNSVQLSWTFLTKDTTLVGNIKYEIYTSLEDNIETVSQIKSNGNLVVTLTDLQTEAYETYSNYTITGLNEFTTYYFNILAIDINDEKSAYKMVSAVTASSPIVVKTTSITQFGITWTFDKVYDAGQFANGDYWVVGPVTIISIDPISDEYLGEIASEDLGKYPGGIRFMHGSMVNPSPKFGTRNGYDNYIGDYPNNYDFEYDPLLNVARPGGANLDISNPLILQPDSSLVSVISRTLAELEAASDPKANLKSCAILTVLVEPPPEGSFRPPYCGADKQIKFNKNILDYNKLSKLTSVEDTPRLQENADDNQADSLERMFERPWLDHIPDWPIGYYHPAENMPWYGRNLAAQIGDAALMLHLDFTDAEKETLLIRFIQLGIDLYGVVEDGGENNWIPTGGITMGRKWPILFAGVMLNDSDMKNIGQRTDVYFGEDGQTFYVDSNTITIGTGYSSADIGLPEWGIRHSTNPSSDNKAWSADYRRCCTANSWAGFILAAHIMGLKNSWNHNALFDYQDRYMSLGTYDSYMRQWSNFTENMWDAYRADYGSVWTAK